MSENNQMMSVEGQLVGMPLAGPESFSQQQLEYLKRALGVDETVLYHGTTNISSGTLSEAATNFRMLRVCFAEKATTASTYNGGELVGFVDLSEYSNGNNPVGCCAGIAFQNIQNATALGMRIGLFKLTSSTTFSSEHYEKKANGTAAGDTIGNLYVTKVIGIGRIAGGN